jgi:hypothetical protein
LTFGVSEYIYVNNQHTHTNTHFSL